MKGLLISILLLFTIVANTQQSDPFAQANAEYKTGNYTQAISSYEQLVSQGLVSKELYYNLGNAYYNDNKLGHAILNFERALKLAPRDTNIRTNLDIANAEVELELLEVPPFFLLRFLVSSSVWVILQIILVLLSLYSLYLYTLSRNSSSKIRGLKMLAILLPLLLVAYLAGRTAHHQEAVSEEGVILLSTQLLSEPLENSELLEDLTPGVKVLLMDSLEEWYKVSLVNKAQGWTRKDAVGII